MRCVIDASVAAKWVIAEPDSDRAVRLLDEYRQGQHEFLAPDWLLAEVANILGKAAVRRGLLTSDQARQGFAAVAGLDLNLHPSSPLVTSALELALQHSRAVYDCLYVALAEREQCQLITADQALVNELSPRLPFVVSLASCPV